MPPLCKTTEARSLERTAMAVRAMGITQALQSAAGMDMTTKHLPTYSITKGPVSGPYHIQFVEIHGRDSRTRMPAISSNGQFSSPQHAAIPTTPTMPATSPGNSSSAWHNPGTSNWRGTPDMADAGGFFHVLHTVAQVHSALDASLSSLLGPVSGLSSAAAGTLLACVCRVALSTGGFTNMDGISERALAAEAALQAVLWLEPSPEKGEVIHKMQIIWSANAPNLEGLANRLALALTQCALDIAIHRLSKTTTSDPRRLREGYVSFLPQRRYLDVGAVCLQLLGKDVPSLKASSSLPWSLLGRRNSLGGSNPSWRWLSRMKHPTGTNGSPPPKPISDRSQRPRGPEHV